MFVKNIIRQIDLKVGRGIVFAAGGSADIILAKSIALELIEHGCQRVDLAQPLNCKKLSEEGLLSEASELYKTEPEVGLEPEAVLKHYSTVPSICHTDSKRGKGLSISSSLKWDHGSRYLCAAHGGGPSALAGRMDDGRSFYDFAVGVDGGGDVLTHGDEEFDRVVLNGFSSGWRWDKPLVMIAMGLGGDGGSSPEEFEGVGLKGWRQLPISFIDEAFAQSLQHTLVQLGLWNDQPEHWHKTDPYWGYGLKVPQIMALTVMGRFPFTSSGRDKNIVLFPRRRELKQMDKRLLRQVRAFQKINDL